MKIRRAKLIKGLELTTNSDPFYTGPGNHSVAQLEKIIEVLQRDVHNEKIKFQRLKKYTNTEIV